MLYALLIRERERLGSKGVQEKREEEENRWRPATTTLSVIRGAVESVHGPVQQQMVYEKGCEQYESCCSRSISLIRMCANASREEREAELLGSAQSPGMKLPGKKKRRLAALGLLLGSLVLLLPSLCLYYNDGVLASRGTRALLEDVAADFINFDGFDNETGIVVGGRFIVPNIVHYIRFNKTALTFVEYVCLRSAYLHQRPDRIFIHTNVPGGVLNGTYWDQIRRSQPDLYSRIVVLPIELPSEIFGQPLSEGWRVYHGSDIARIRTLIKYGGIYLDNDVYVVQSLDKYRKYEMALGWDEGQFLGSQVIVAHKDARFLPLWLETYKDNYHSDLW